MKKILILFILAFGSFYLVNDNIASAEFNGEDIEGGYVDIGGESVGGTGAGSGNNNAGQQGGTNNSGSQQGSGNNNAGQMGGGQTGSQNQQSPTLGEPIVIFDPVQKTIPEIFRAILDIIMVFAIPIILFFIVWAGFLYVKASGNPDKISQAHNALLYALIGGLIILGANVILAVITNTINVFVN
jgi:hypothetical protein